ncbi:MAG: hypothetical protein ACRCRZ_00830 [Metamycoplasmataceae bacterium]
MTDDKQKGILYINNISDYYISDLNVIFKEGDFLFLKEILVKKNVKYFDFKEDRPRFLRQPFSFDLEETKNNFINLKNKVDEDIKKWTKLK